MRLRQHLLHQLAGFSRRRIKVAPTFVDLRKSDGWHAKQIAFHRGAHGARVNRVVAHVGAVVDARHHEVGFVIEQACQRNVHAIRRRAIHVAKTVAGLVHIQG